MGYDGARKTMFALASSRARAAVDGGVGRHRRSDPSVIGGGEHPHSNCVNEGEPKFLCDRRIVPIARRPTFDRLPHSIEVKKIPGNTTRRDFLEQLEGVSLL